MLTKIDFYYFSPTGGTKKAGEMFCDGLSQNVKALDLGKKDVEVEEPKSDLIVAAAPVFGGRIPAIAAEKLRALNGEGKKAVTLAVYGTRAYEDALLEMNQILEERGFQIVASAALIARHSIVPEVGEGRPDEKDQEEIRGFARDVLERLEKDVKGSVKVPGNYPYKDGMSTGVSPVSLENCNSCGTCEKVCPTGAVHVENGKVVNAPEKCILCMACVYACPRQARVLPQPLQENMNQKLGVLKSVRRENEFFL